MNASVLVGIRPLAILAAATVLSLVLLVYPLWRLYPDDRGDGIALVLLPKPQLPSQLRTLAFVLTFVALNIIEHAVKGAHTPDALYGHAVNDLASTVVRAPSEINGYISNFDLGLRFLIAGTMISLAVVCRGNCWRRLLVVGQAVWFGVAMLMVDSMLTVITVLLGLPLAPDTLLGNFFAVGLGFLGMARLLYVNFALPRPSQIQFVPRPRFEGGATLLACTFSAVALCMSALLILYHIADPRYRPLLVLVVPIPFGYLAVILRSVLLLGLARFAGQREPEVGAHRPLIQVIIPAYNEEEVIVGTLEAIDRAACRYGGPVEVILANDASTDRTRQIALETIDGFGYATGRVIDVSHGGKSATLNAALAVATADLIVRIDADTLIGEWALYYIPRWFREPSVGMVEALIWPRWRRSPFPRMRLFEELKQFGVLHRSLAQVDGINVVPGVFTAFRRQAGLAVSGFTIGMNGEDGDFTLKMSRLGWQTRQDPRIVVYEDVPPTYSEIREQRVRWDRATLHNQARHGPYRAGLATPKVWFAQTHQFFSRTFAPIRLMLPLYLLILAAFKGTYTTPLLLAVGTWFVAQVAFMAYEVVLAVAYHHERRVAWVLLWPFWQLLLIVFSTESWLSLPGRPASVLRGAVPLEVRTAVVH